MCIHKPFRLFLQIFGQTQNQIVIISAVSVLIQLPAFIPDAGSIQHIASPVVKPQGYSLKNSYFPWLPLGEAVAEGD
jgi:hypothetical protein